MLSPQNAGRRSTSAEGIAHTQAQHLFKRHEDLCKYCLAALVRDAEARSCEYWASLVGPTGAAVPLVVVGKGLLCLYLSIQGISD